MKNPIPTDWDGETWKRFVVCWPDSPLWIGLLLGFITYATRGRSWDEKTGTITDIQAIGRQIYENNYPLQEVALSCQEAQELTRAVIILYHAIASLDFDGLAEISNQAYLDGYWEFSQHGLAHRLAISGPESSHFDISYQIAALKTSIDELKDALVSSGGTGEDLEDDLAKVWRALDDITEVLGGSVSAPPVPL